MGDYGSDRDFYYRMAEPLFHSVLVRSATVIFHETTNGPFRREDTEFAPWSPPETETDAVTRYVGELEAAVKGFMAAQTGTR